MHLKELRQKNGLTQAEIAARLYIQQSAYSRYERGERRLPLDVLIRLALYFHTSTDYILELTDDPAPYPRRQ